MLGHCGTHGRRLANDGCPAFWTGVLKLVISPNEFRLSCAHNVRSKLEHSLRRDGQRTPSSNNAFDKAQSLNYSPLLHISIASDPANLARSVRSTDRNTNVLVDPNPIADRNKRRNKNRRRHPIFKRAESRSKTLRHLAVARVRPRLASPAIFDSFCPIN